jgi:hypothetical protein
MSLSIFEYGDGRFRLFHGDREIGWLEGRVVGFTGFDSEAAAVRAATVAHDALSAWLARQNYKEVVRRRGRRLGVHARDSERHLTIGGISIGRLVVGPADDAEKAASVGFELSLPPRIGAAFTAAQVVDQALVRHRELLGLEKAARTEMPEALV